MSYLIYHVIVGNLSFFSLPQGLWILIPQPGIELGPLEWNYGILTTGPLENSLSSTILKSLRLGECAYSSYCENLILNFKCLHIFIFFMAYIFYIHSCSRPESSLNQASQVVKWLKKKSSKCGLGPWFRKTPWRREWQPTPIFLPGKSHEQWNLDGYSPWGCKESVRTWVTEHTGAHYLLLCSQSVRSLQASQWAFDDSPQFLHVGASKWCGCGSGPLEFEATGRLLQGWIGRLSNSLS